MRGVDAIAHVAVVVPVRDEEALLPRCLDSIALARELLASRRPDVRCDVVVVLDRCRDGSRAAAVGRADAVLEIDAGNVGAARSRGVAHAADLAGPAWLTSGWIAHTDADSIVPPHWLLEHVWVAESGHDVLIGTVRPDPDELDPRRLAAWRLTWSPVANGHVHGANLGMRAATDALVGGIAALVEHEDIDVVARARAAGARTTATNQCEVLTSARLVGRTAGGYAGYLREGLPTAGGTPPVTSPPSWVTMDEAPRSARSDHPELRNGGEPR